MSQRKDKQLAHHAAMSLQRLDLDSEDDTEPYGVCEVKKHWNNLTKEKWIEACQDLYGEVGRHCKEVVSFGPWEKALLEFFFLAPHAWPDSREIPSGLCQDLAPGLILSMRDLPGIESSCEELEEAAKRDSGEGNSSVQMFYVLDYMLLYSNLTYDLLDLQEFIVSIGVDEKERSHMAQKEAEAVLQKFKFGEGFSLQGNCVRVIKDLVLKHVKGETCMGYTLAVDRLPLPELMMNMIDPIMPSRFDTASCPMYKLVASFAKGKWLNTPLRFRNMFDLGLSKKE